MFKVWYTWFMDLIGFVSIYMLSELVYMAITDMGCHNIITSKKNIVQMFICSQRSNFLWLLSLAKTPRCCPVLEFWTIPLVPRVERVRVRQGQAGTSWGCTSWFQNYPLADRYWLHCQRLVACAFLSMRRTVCLLQAMCVKYGALHDFDLQLHEHSTVADLDALVAHFQALSLHVCQMP